MKKLILVILILLLVSGIVVFFLIRKKLSSVPVVADSPEGSGSSAITKVEDALKNPTAEQKQQFAESGAVDVKTLSEEQKKDLSDKGVQVAGQGKTVTPTPSQPAQTVPVNAPAAGSGKGTVTTQTVTKPSTTTSLVKLPFGVILPANQALRIG